MKQPPAGVAPTSVAGVTLHTLPHIIDARGDLSVAEVGEHVPFEVKRYFVVFGVSSGEIRGEHAHRTLHQFLVCVHGQCELVADDGRTRETFVLDRPSLAVYLPPMVWGVQHSYTPGSVLLVLASDHYDPADYIRNYDEFLALVKKTA
jgi:UDP-2-acetamido-3-amino-2,3-dideoxy-glucuronate N-acetyltransferase